MTDKPTRTLTLEIEVPADQVPENATGRLKYCQPDDGDFVISSRDPKKVWQSTCNISPDLHLVIETREPWKVPEHLRHSVYNGWEMRKGAAFGAVTVWMSSHCSGRAVYTHELTDIGIGMALSESDFDGMEPGKVYKLGEGAE